MRLRIRARLFNNLMGKDALLLRNPIKITQFDFNYAIRSMWYGIRHRGGEKHLARASQGFAP
jgi:hypothetical protein